MVVPYFRKLPYLAYVFKIRTVHVVRFGAMGRVGISVQVLWKCEHGADAQALHEM